MVDGSSDRDRDGTAAPNDLATMTDLEEMGRPRRRRSLLTAFSALLCVAALIAIAVITTATDEDRSKPRVDQVDKKEVVDSPEAQQVFAAVGETIATGSYTASYETHSIPASPGEEQACGAAVPPPDPDASVGCLDVAHQAVDITGVATINTAPYRMEATSQVTGFGTIVIHVDGTRLWEKGGGNYGYNNPYGSVGGPGDSISGFASLVSGTLGRGPGALTMLTLANPNGYLNLQQAAVSGVTPAGTGVVNGVAVTYFDVVIDNAKLLDIPGLTAEQTKTITEALAQLRAAGLQTGGTTKVGIDAAGFIRETSSTATFEDGTRQLSRTRFSNFGCAGFVTLPGEAPAPPAKPCAPTTPTTTAPAPADTTTTSVAPATTTTTLSANEPPAPAVDEFGQPLPPPGWKMPTIDGKPACDRYGPSCPAPPEG